MNSLYMPWASAGSNRRESMSTQTEAMALGEVLGQPRVGHQVEPEELHVGLCWGTRPGGSSGPSARGGDGDGAHASLSRVRRGVPLDGDASAWTAASRWSRRERRDRAIPGRAAAGRAARLRAHGDARLRAGALGRASSEAGITHRIEAVPDAEGDEVARAGPARTCPTASTCARRTCRPPREVDREYLRSQIPDLPARRRGRRWEEGCPACGAPLAPDAAECPDCGLRAASNPR